jgi:hypothetical protein
MLCGFPMALCAVIVAFHRTSGLVFAFVAFALVASQILLVTWSIRHKIGAYPMVVGLIAISSLGTYGVIRARHPIGTMVDDRHVDGHDPVRG